MTQHRLHDLYIKSRLAHTRCKSMPQYMTVETGEEHRLIVNVVFFKDFAITIPHDSAQCLIQCSLMLYLSESVDKEVINAKTAAPDTLMRR